ncbi:stomatin-like protein 1 [Protopterus annectens]|uniref:stomatin-like protein 1 n=1 Tax=Protopterus annectens TaxID=7888 RepID=UPI001CF9AC41|nr:stomatin-like protein 1 [Protopterus annectens]
MFGKSGYQAVPLGDWNQPSINSELYKGTSSNILFSTDAGSSYDYVPKIDDSDLRDKSQGLLSWICSGIVTLLVALLTLVTLPISGWFVLKVVPNYERIVLFRLGRIRAPKGPGVVLVLPFIDQWKKVDLRTKAFNVPPCKIMTKDGALISVGADIQFRVWNPVLSLVAVQDLNNSTRMTAQNVMTDTLIKKRLKEIQTEKLRIEEYLVADINYRTKAWGIEVDRVEMMIEAVIKLPEGSVPGGHLIMPPGVPGLECLSGPLQQMAMHFLSKDATPTQQEAGSIEIVNETTCVSAPTSLHLSVEDLLSAVEVFLSESLVNRVQALYQFNITMSNGTVKTCFLDLSQGTGKAGQGVPCNTPDVVLDMSEEDLLAIFSGNLRPLGAYMSGRVQVHGDLKTAMRLEEVVKALKHQ